MRNLNIVKGQISCTVVNQVTYLVCVLFFLSSCRPEGEFHQNQLLGKWEITKAERNGKETSYLRRGYFLIEQNVMTINITGEDEKGSYTMNRNKLIMGDKNFDLEKVEKDTMIVKYTSGPNSEFIFRMLKKKEDAQ